eukprot:1091183-Ditylum_brightwellii.AAC.1
MMVVPSAFNFLHDQKGSVLDVLLHHRDYGVSFIAHPGVVAMVHYVSTRISFECAQMLESVPTQGQRVNVTYLTNTKGTHKWEAGGSATPVRKGKSETLLLLDLSHSTLSTQIIRWKRKTH